MSAHSTGSVNAAPAGTVAAQVLLAHGVDTVFCVPGESYIHLLDGLYDTRDAIRVIVCRHESAAAFMAEAWGKLTGRPGVCLVTRGPGATNGAIGVHVARQDDTPMIMLIGQADSAATGRDTFQEVDFPAMFAPLAKWAAQVERSERLPEFLHRAFRVAVSGRPGPVALALPEDMLERAIPPNVGATGARSPTRSALRSQDAAALADAFAKAQQPLILVGGAGWSADARNNVNDFAQRHHIGLATAFRRNDLADHESDVYLGPLGIGANPDLIQRARECDLLLAIGAELGEATTQSYTAPDPEALASGSLFLAHVHPGADRLGVAYQPNLAINMRPDDFSHALATLPMPANPPWRRNVAAGRASHLAWSAPPTPDPNARGVNLATFVALLRETAPDDALVTSDAGNFAGWLNRFYAPRGYPAMIGPANGAMGYGVPSAIAAAIAQPSRTVIAFCGDGGFMMSASELATAVAEKTNILVLVFNNSMFGTIRMHQEMRFPGRIIATDLTNPDFVALAQAYGAWSARIDSNADAPNTLAEALQRNGVRVLEIIADPNAITPAARIDQLQGALA